jgi:hypothetical protein
MRRLVITGVAIVAVFGLSASSCDRKGLGDAPIGEQHEAPRQVWLSGDSFMNISPYCIGANGVYTHTREAPPAVVANDPNCAEGGVLANG